MVKEGDKFYCKRSFGLLVAGNSYSIDRISHISSKNDYMIFFIINYSQHWFLLNDKNSIYYFYDYFDNVKLERKKKLKNILGLWNQ